ncbi:hypothetical protein B296_00047329 [Ensete ventricosum]|uniref:Uncharacterized protein n=1 Tax=Ensete ventricosum TaxID=4639 RepID=A0A426XX85_ENSVE|nr:hypothetical protein B296_00047329 [Ensete ventricosum]
MIGLMVAERYISVTIRLMVVERRVLGTTGLMMANRCILGTIGLMMAERCVSSMIGLMVAERCVSGMIGPMVAERRVSGTTGLMVTKTHISGTIGLMVTEIRILGMTGLMMIKGFSSFRPLISFDQVGCPPRVRLVSGSFPLPVQRGCGPRVPKLASRGRHVRGYLPRRMPDHGGILRVDWSIHLISNVPPLLSEEESIMVNRLRGILPLSQATRDMTEKWLVEVRLSPTSRGAMDLSVLRKKPRMPGWKSAPAAGPESTQPEVEVIHMETSAKRHVGSMVADQATISRPGKWVKIAVRKHKSHRDKGSSRWATREREPEVSAKDSSPTCRRPKLMKDLCGIQVREDEEGYYILQMANWALKDSSAVMRARWPNLLYQARADNAKLRSGVDKLTSRLVHANKEIDELREGLAESQRQLKEQKVDPRKADDELLKLMRENEFLKAELPGRSVANHKQSVLGNCLSSRFARMQVRSRTILTTRYGPCQREGGE